jgi:hypothetical protein
MLLDPVLTWFWWAAAPRFSAPAAFLSSFATRESASRLVPQRGEPRRVMRRARRVVLSMLCMLCWLASSQVAIAQEQERLAAAKRACDGGDAKACLVEATAPRWSLPDYERLAFLFTRACDGGSGTGCCWLGGLYDKGYGVKEDQPRARALQKKAVRLGYRCDATPVPYAGIGHGVGCCEDDDEPSSRRRRQEPWIHGDVVPEQLSVQGDLDSELVRRIVRRHLYEVRSCYEHELLKTAQLGGHFELVLDISNTGKVKAAMVRQSTLKNPQLEQCIAAAGLRWDFLKPKDGKPVVVSYPFTLKSTVSVQESAEQKSEEQNSEKPTGNPMDREWYLDVGWGLIVQHHCNDHLSDDEIVKRAVKQLSLDDRGFGVVTMRAHDCNESESGGPAADDKPRPIQTDVVPGAPQVTDGLDAEQVRSVGRLHTDELQVCFERQSHSKIAVDLEFTVERDGHVTAPRVRHSSSPAPRMQECLVKNVSGWEFPAPRGGANVYVIFPFRFATAKP